METLIVEYLVSQNGYEEGNNEAKEAYEKNIFSVTRQLRYSDEYGRLALDICLFLNGLPIITIEHKNQFTKQTYKDAIQQYKTDCSHRLVAREKMSIKLEDGDAEIDAVPVKTDVGIPVPELDTLTNILATFHDIWGNCDWTDEEIYCKRLKAVYVEKNGILDGSHIAEFDTMDNYKVAILER